METLKLNDLKNLKKSVKSIRDYLKAKNETGVFVFISKNEDNLIYVDFPVENPNEESVLIDKYESFFNSRLNSFGITVEVRKNWI